MKKEINDTTREKTDSRGKLIVLVHHSAADKLPVSAIDDNSAKVLAGIFDVQADDISITEAQPDLHKKMK